MVLCPAKGAHHACQMKQMTNILGLTNSVS